LPGKRITILSKDEYGYLYDIPELTHKDRVVLFDLSEADHEEINKLPTDPAKIDYILQLGYFRAKQYFFNFTFQQVRQDVWFIINNYFPDAAFPKKQISKRSHYENQKRLLKQFEFRTVTHNEIIQIQRHATKLAGRHVHPRFMLDKAGILDNAVLCFDCPAKGTGAGAEYFVVLFGQKGPSGPGCAAGKRGRFL
jgi:hypothetical protein